MKIFRSIVGVFIGLVVAVAVIFGSEIVNTMINRPDDGRSFGEFVKSVQDDKKAMKAWIESVPEAAMVTVLLVWEFGAFLGGAAAALIAGHWRRLHAVLIGIFVLAGTILNFRQTQVEFDITHPDYMIVLGLLLPIPCSLLGGQLVSLMFPSRPAEAHQS